MKQRGKHIRWMMELPERCDHPLHCLEFREGLLVDCVECVKCGESLSRDYARALRKIEDNKEQQTL